MWREIGRILEAGLAAGGTGVARKAYTTCLVLFAVLCVKTGIENQYFFSVANMGVQLRGALGTVRVSLFGSWTGGQNRGNGKERFLQ